MPHFHDSSGAARTQRAPNVLAGAGEQNDTPYFGSGWRASLT